MVVAHRRLQDGPAPAGRPPHRPARLRAAGRGGHRPAARPTRPTPRSPASSRPSATSRNVLRHGLRQRREADHRGELRQPRAPHPADPRRRPRVRPQGRLRRPLDGPQHGHRPRPRLPEGPRRAWSSTSRRSTTCRTTRSCWSARAPRASRWPRCPGWPTATTRSGSSRATR